MTVHYDDGTVRILHGDARDLLPGLHADVIVTDPPYSLSFMGRTWDRHPSPRAYQAWTEKWATLALQTLPPGGWLLAFGGTRTSHRLAAGLEDAGFELRDTIMWLYASGFPKSLDVSKAIDAQQLNGKTNSRGLKQAAEQRPDGGPNPYASRRGSSGSDFGHQKEIAAGYKTDATQPYSGQDRLTAPATPEAARWQGWGTALKPSWEPIIVARKPLAGTVAQNVLEYGTGALNIDACRIGAPDAPDAPTFAPNAGARYVGVLNGGKVSAPEPQANSTSNAGRWPPNVAMTHGPGCQPVGTRKVQAHWGQPTERTTSPRYSGTAYNGGQVGGTKEDQPIGYADPDGTKTVQAWDCEPGCPVALLDQQSGERRSAGLYPTTYSNGSGYGGGIGKVQGPLYADQGGASRFYFTAKASRAERVTVDGEQHPTVKPLALMRWLVRLVTPPGGTVLDPFCGSGSTLVAAALEGFRAVGIEADEQWCRGSAKRVAERPPAQEVLAL